MASDSFRVAQKGDVFRVVQAGNPVPKVDNGGFKRRQDALDAAMQANLKNRKLGTGKADQARSSLQNRTNRLDKVLSGAK